MEKEEEEAAATASTATPVQRAVSPWADVGRGCGAPLSRREQALSRRRSALRKDKRAAFCVNRRRSLVEEPGD